MYWYICWYDPLSADWGKIVDVVEKYFPLKNIYFEEVEGGAPAKAAVLNLGLGEKILGGADGVVEVLCCERGCEVGGVGGDHDEGEQVPHARYEPADGDQEGEANK